MRNEKQIREYLTEVADVLGQLSVNKPFHILISGGAFMLLQKKRTFTEDIDFASIAVPHRVPRGKFQATVIQDEVSKPRSGIAFAREFRHAILEVANRHAQLGDDWLNDQAAEYLYDDAPYPDVQLWEVFGSLLYVYLPSPEYILATKLAASRPKDTRDIEVLMKELKIKKREQMQKIVDRFLVPAAQEFWQVDERIDDLFS